MSHRDIPLAGKFDCWHQDFEFPDLLLAVCRQGKTGHLRFESGEAEKTVVLQKGRIIFAKSSSADDRLGPYLLKTGRIRFDHLTDLSRFISPTKRFGTVLVENNVISPKDLAQGVIGQVRSIVLSLFNWDEAMYAFEERELEKETITLRIPTEKLILDGVRTVASWRRVTGGIGSLDAVYQTVDGIDDALSEVELDAPTVELLSDLRGPKTIAEACAGSELGDFVVCQTLWALHSLGWVSPVTEASLPVVEADGAESDGEPSESEVEPIQDEDGFGLVLGQDPLA
jgi:two-component system OmpR family response regulator